MVNVKKKNLYNLRQELLNAEEHLAKLCLYGDHIVLVFPYSLKEIEHKKKILKRYIQTSFEKVINVDLFTQYLVIWHDFEMLSPEHIKKNMSE